MLTFEYAVTAPRVTFGKGNLPQISSMLEKLGIKAAMILSTPEQIEIADQIKGILGGVVVSTFNGAVMHTPARVTEAALSQANKSRADGIVSVGGGSTIGLGKAISVRARLPHVCIPTTYAGIEALYAGNGNPIIDLMACEGIKSLCEALPVIQTDSQDNDARYKALYGAWLCGMCLGAVDMALHHKLCHALGGSFDLPHAETHVSILPHALAFNAPYTNHAMVKLAAALPDSGGDAVSGINALYRRLGIAPSLRALGMPEDGIDKAADIAVSNPYRNPRPLSRDALRELVRRAWAGEPASTEL